MIYNWFQYLFCKKKKQKKTILKKYSNLFWHLLTERQQVSWILEIRFSVKLKPPQKVTTGQTMKF